MEASAQNISARSRSENFPLDPAARTQSRIAAAIYGLLAVYYAAVTTVLLGRAPWTSFEQFSQDLIARPGAIAVLLGFVTANAVFAACAWSVLSISRSARWLLMLAALGATVWLWGIFALAAWRWISLGAGPGDPWILAASAVQVLLYGVCAYLVVRVVTTANRRQTPV
jgi:hypothetical protein